MPMNDVLTIAISVSVGLLSVAMTALLGYQFYTALQMRRAIQKECQQQMSPLLEEVSKLHAEIEEVATYAECCLMNYKEEQHWEKSEHEEALLTSLALLGTIIPYWDNPRFHVIRDCSINTITIQAQSKKYQIHLRSKNQKKHPLADSIRISAQGLRTSLLGVRNESHAEMHKLLEALRLLGG